MRRDWGRPPLHPWYARVEKTAPTIPRHILRDMWSKNRTLYAPRAQESEEFFSEVTAGHWEPPDRGERAEWQYQELADCLGISRQAVQQIEASALRKMRHALEKIVR